MFRSLLMAVSCLLLMAGCVSSNKMSDNSIEQYRDLSDHSVMITSDEGGGGSGVVLKSSDKGSYVLTNKHICQAVQEGGDITTKFGRSRVDLMKMSKMHDLCLIRTNKNLHINTKLAKRAGAMYDLSIVSGHPHLLPNIIAKGHFSGYLTASLMTGIEQCTGDEESEEDMFYCAMFGMKPLIEKFESQAISSIIAPGNSGSPVFNANGEIAGLVFAGNGEDLSHGIIVPHGYVVYFLQKEIKQIRWQRPMKQKKTAKRGKQMLEKPVLISVDYK